MVAVVGVGRRDVEVAREGESEVGVGAQRVRGANPPRTKPTPVATASDAKPVWKPRRAPKKKAPTVDANTLDAPPTAPPAPEPEDKP